MDCLLGFTGPSSSQKLSVGTKEMVADTSLVHTNDMVLLLPFSFLCFLVLFRFLDLREIFHSAAQATLELNIEPRLFSNSPSFCLSHPSAGITGVHCPIWLVFVFSSFITFPEK